MGAGGYTCYFNCGAPDTFGSVTRPAENGGGGRSAGGGTVKVIASSIVLPDVTSRIRANGTGASGTGAGGSVWIVANSLSGAGSIEANGGSSGTANGGGGAIAPMA